MYIKWPRVKSTWECQWMWARQFLHLSQATGLEEGAGLDGSMSIYWRQGSPRGCLISEKICKNFKTPKP